jgi:LuxR family maltose regulon positive regulatory protein
MSEVALGSSGNLPEPTLLPLKLVPPQSRGDVLLRPDLQALLAEVRLRSAALVVAPAGYGKTTLLTQWAAALERTGAPVCWLGFEAGDEAPPLLLAYLIRAFQRQYPQVGEQAWRMLNSVADLSRDWALAAGALIGDLQSEITTPTYLIIDDFHVIADGPISNVLLGYLLRTAPPLLRVVIASRRPLSMAPLPRLRAEGRLVEVSRQDLSLTNEEAAALLERFQVTLVPAELQLLLERTEGWVLSVQLAARTLARQAPEQRRAYLETLDSNQQSLFEYLASEVLDELPSDLIDFLARASLTDQIDAELLAEALEMPNAVELLERSRQMGMPISPSSGADGRLLGYEFHPLWRRLLRNRARGLFDAAALADLHRRIGAAYERRNWLEEALEHFRAAHDDEALARALRDQGWPLIDTPQRETIRHWLEELPAELRERDPELIHMWGWSLAGSARDQAFQAISRAAELYHAQGAYQRELRALSDLAELLFWEDRPVDFVAVCVRAVLAANRARDAWSRGAALVSVVAMLYSRGRYAAALRVAGHARNHPRSSFWRWLLAVTVASIQIQQGYPAAALDTIRAALTVPRIDRDDRLRQNLLRLESLALYLQGHMVEATSLGFETYRRLSDYYSEGVVGSNAAVLALLLIEQGRLEEATTYLSRARTIANRVGAPALLARVQVIESYSLLLNGHTAEAIDVARKLLRQSHSVIEGDGQRGTFPRELPSSGEAGVAAIESHDLWLLTLLLIVFGEGGADQRAVALADELTAMMQQRRDGLFLAVVLIYRSALATRHEPRSTPHPALEQGWRLCAEHDLGYLPLLPASVLKDAVEQALRYGLALDAVGNILRGQLLDEAIELLRAILEQPLAAETRARVAELFGDLGAVSAYPALRAMLKDRSQEVRDAATEALGRLVYRPAYRLRVRSMGGFSVWRGEVEIRDRDWRSVKARQLLQLLLVERGRMLPRDRIVDMLWPGLESDAAANNLRVTLSRLTKAIEPNRPEGAPTYYIIQQGDTYGFNIESDHGYDAAEFSEAVEQARVAEYHGNHEAALGHYRRAIDLYGGVFLPDCLYEDWSVVERERLGLMFTEAALRLGRMLLAQSQAHEAIGLAWRVLEQDQAQEEAYQLLMSAYSRLGERSTALRLYARCVSALEQELGVEPLPETVAMYKRIREGMLPA